MDAIRDSGMAVALFPVVGSGSSAGTAVLVSAPCHIEPYVKFALIRLSDSLRLAAFEVMTHIVLADRRPPSHCPSTGQRTPAPSSIPDSPAWSAPAGALRSDPAGAA